MYVYILYITKLERIFINFNDVMNYISYGSWRICIFRVLKVYFFTFMITEMERKFVKKRFTFSIYFIYKEELSGIVFKCLHKTWDSKWTSTVQIILIKILIKQIYTHVCIDVLGTCFPPNYFLMESLTSSRLYSCPILRPSCKT